MCETYYSSFLFTFQLLMEVAQAWSTMMMLRPRIIIQIPIGWMVGYPTFDAWRLSWAKWTCRASCLKEGRDERRRRCTGIGIGLLLRHAGMI